MTEQQPGSIEYVPVKPEDLKPSDIESPALAKLPVGSISLDEKYEVPKPVGQKPEDVMRAQGIKNLLTNKVESPKSPEIKDVGDMVNNPSKESDAIQSLMNKYGYYGKKVGLARNPQEIIQSGIRFENSDIKEKSVLATVVMTGGGMFSVLGIAMANSAGQGVISSGIVSLINGGVATDIVGTVSAMGLGVFAVVGPVLLAGGALYLGYQGLRKIKNIVNNNRAKEVFA